MKKLKMIPNQKLTFEEDRINHNSSNKKLSKKDNAVPSISSSMP